MSTCHVISNWNGAELRQGDASFKSQKIYNECMLPVAEEILFDGRSRSTATLLKDCPLYFSHPIYLDDLLYTAEQRIQTQSLSRVFINIEQETLCDQLSLAKIILLNQRAEHYGCELVVEVTERMRCGSCIRSYQGLLTLKTAQVKVALDDYDTYGAAAEDTLLDPRLFDIVKVIRPNNLEQLHLLSEFIHLRSTWPHQELVIENIETQHEFKLLLGCEPLLMNFYLQGYLFHRPESIN